MSSKVCRDVLGPRRGHFRPLIAFLSISGHMVGHIVRSQKYMKIAKIAIWARNSIFDTAADISQNDDIWPEMGSWGVLELFCTRNRYLNSFRSNFEKLWKNRFFGDFHLWDHQMWTRRIFYWPRKFDIEISTGPNISKLFQKKNGNINFQPILT